MISDFCPANETQFFCTIKATTSLDIPLLVSSSKMQMMNIITILKNKLFLAGKCTQKQKKVTVFKSQSSTF
jgi:hypothetical protein